MDRLKDLIVISIYEAGYYITIWIDGEEVDKTHPIYKCCPVLLTVEEIKELAERFQKSVLVCEDGEIQYHRYEVAS